MEMMTNETLRSSSTKELKDMIYGTGKWKSKNIDGDLKMQVLKEINRRDKKRPAGETI